MDKNFVRFPKQKLPLSKKNKQWVEECIDAGLYMTTIYDNTRRSPRSKKIRNYNLYNGKFDKADLAYVCNPLGLSDDGYDFPANMQYYPVATPIFDLLFGEEAKRAFSYIVKSIGPEAISEKEKARKEEIIQAVREKLAAAVEPQQPSPDGQPQEPPKEPEEIIKYYKYSYQDIRETTATKTLNYLTRQLDTKYTFQKGWEDVLLAGEEIYKVEVIAGEPVMNRCNPIEIYALLPHNKDILDEAEIVVEETWMSVSEIVDCYYDELTAAEIDRLEDVETTIDTLGNSAFVVPEQNVIGLQEGGSLVDSTIYDPEGNARVCKVTWKSKKKVGELTYMDEMGNEQSITVEEGYKKEDGEELKWFWINEYWEGVKIAEDIYLKTGAKSMQFRRMDNISACKSGYIGTVYNANNSQSVSLMDRLVPWIYMYIVMWYRTELLIAANQGKIALIDLALIPEGWEIEKWLYYAQAMKFGFVDSFNEGRKGQSTGKLAGNISTQNKTLDLETGNAINGHIQLIDFIEQKIKELAGVTDQRLGSISASETVGNAKGAIVQSSHITEKWFMLHNWTKKRVLSAMVEAAKEAWKDGSKKLQYITDDLATEFFNIDQNTFTDSEYGVFVSDSAKDIEALGALKELTHAAMQNDRIMLSSVADVYSSDSLSDVKAKLMEVEEQSVQRQEKAQESQQEAVMKVEQLKKEAEDAKIKQKYYEIDKDNETKIIVAEINSFKMQEDQDVNDNGVPDQLEIEKLKIQVHHNQQKIDLENRKLDAAEHKHQDDIKIKEKQIKNKPKSK